MEIALILKVENYFNMHNSLLGKKKIQLFLLRKKLRQTKKNNKQSNNPSGENVAHHSKPKISNFYL